MATSPAKALLLLHLLFLLKSFFLVVHAAEWKVSSLAASPKPHEHQHSHPPAYPPSHPPGLDLSNPPAKAPFPPRKLIAVHGYVLCKSCESSGNDTIWDSPPLEGSTVKLECNSSKLWRIAEKATTAKNGSFVFTPRAVTNFGSHKCKVFLVSSSSATCNVPTNINNGIAGATLQPAQKDNPKFEVYIVGPFAYEPSKKSPCPS